MIHYYISVFSAWLWEVIGTCLYPHYKSLQCFCSVDRGESRLEPGENIEGEAFPGGAGGSLGDASCWEMPTLSSNVVFCQIDERHTGARTKLYSLIRQKTQTEEEHTLVKHCVLKMTCSMQKPAHLVSYVHEYFHASHVFLLLSFYAPHQTYSTIRILSYTLYAHSLLFISITLHMVSYIFNLYILSYLIYHNKLHFYENRLNRGPFSCHLSLQ